MQIDPSRSQNFMMPQPAPSRDAYRDADSLRDSFQFQVYKKSWLSGPDWRNVKPSGAVDELAKAEPAPVRACDPSNKPLVVASLEDLTELRAFQTQNVKTLPSPLLAGSLQVLARTMEFQLVHEGQKRPANAYEAYNFLTRDPNHKATDLTATQKGRSFALTAERAQDLAFLLGFGTEGQASPMAANLATLVHKKLVVTHSLPGLYLDLSEQPDRPHLAVRQDEHLVDQLNGVELAGLDKSAIRRLEERASAVRTLGSVYPIQASTYARFLREHPSIEPAHVLSALPQLGRPSSNATPLLEAMAAWGPLDQEIRKLKPYLGFTSRADQIYAYQNEPEDPRTRAFYQAMLKDLPPPQVVDKLCQAVPADQRDLARQTNETLRKGGIPAAATTRMILAAAQAGKLREHAPFLAGLYSNRQSQNVLSNYQVLADKVRPGCEQLFLQNLAQGMNAAQAAQAADVPPEYRAIFDGLDDRGRLLAHEAIKLGRLEEDAPILSQLETARDYQQYCKAASAGQGPLFLEQLQAGVPGEQAARLALALKPEQQDLLRSALGELAEGGLEPAQAWALAGAAVLADRLPQDQARLLPAATVERYEAMIKTGGHEDFFLTLTDVPLGPARELALHTPPQQQKLARHLLESADPKLVAAAAQAGRLKQDGSRLAELADVERYRVFLKKLPELEGLEEDFLRVAARAQPERIETAWSAIATNREQLVERLTFWEEMQDLPGGDSLATGVLRMLPPGTDIELVRPVMQRMQDRAPAALEKALQAPNPGLSLGLLSAGCTAEEALSLAKQRLPGEELGSLEQGRVLAGLGRLLPDARAAVDAYYFLASQIDQPAELPQAADFFMELQSRTGEEREARLAFNDLTERTMDEQHGELMLEALGHLKTYAATRPVWDCLEQLEAGEARRRYDVAAPFLDSLPEANRSRFLAEHLQQPVEESTWRTLARLIGTRRDPVSEPTLTQMLGVVFNPMLPEEMRRQGLEELNILSQGGDRLELAWGVRPMLPTSMGVGALTDWGEALRLAETPEKAQALARCAGDSNPVELARLGQSRPAEELEGLVRRVRAEGGESAFGLLSRVEARSNDVWEVVSRPVRGETPALRQQLFGELLTACRDHPGTALANWEMLTRELGHPDPLGEPLQATLALASPEPLTRSFLEQVLAPAGSSTLVERTAPANELLASVQRRCAPAEKFWSQVLEAVGPDKLVPTLQAVMPLARENDKALGLVLPEVPRTDLAGRVEAYQAMTCPDRERAGVWEETVRLLSRNDRFPELLAAVDHLTRTSGGLQAVHVLKPIKDETLAERIVAYSALRSVFPREERAAMELWGQIASNMRKADTVASTAQALGELAACFKSRPQQFARVLQRLNEMRTEYGPAKDRSLYLLVHTLTSVTLNRTTDIDQALHMLPDDLPAVIGIEETEQHVQVGSVIVKRRGDQPLA